jgi:Protein of unknown function (DUF2752)
MPQSVLFMPVLSPILRDRKFVIAISGAAVLQVALTAFKLPGWPCPFFHLLGIPCPGCGLTRATVLLFRGDWRESFAFHAFAPLVVVALMISFAAVVLPQRSKDRMIALVEGIETRTGITSLLLFGLILYWLARLLILQSAFVQLIKG